MSDARGRLLAVGAALAVLAIGVVLGSGPLRSALLGGTGDRIDALQAEVDAAESDAAAARSSADRAIAFVDGSAPATLAGLLPGIAVMIVSMPGAPVGALDTVTRRIVLAGGEIAGAVATGPGWGDQDSAPFRAALADQVAPSLVGVSTTDQEAVLAHAFVQGATGAAPTGTDLEAIDAAGGDRGAVLWDLVGQAELATGERSDGADAVVIVAGEDDARALVEAFAAYDAPVTVAGTDAAVGPFVPGDAVATVAVDEWILGSVTAAATVAEAVFGNRPDYAIGDVPAILGVSTVPTGSDG